jgi:hypothetical protein
VGFFIVWNPVQRPGVYPAEAEKREEIMGLVLIMMLGFLVLSGRSSESKRADVKLVELLLAAIFLLFAFGQSAG